VLEENTPEICPFPVPPIVTTRPSLDIAPVFVKLILPALVIILVADAIVINPI
jgi:hypothetical protein